MKRVKLIIAYDGTDFHGFARQKGLRTVEGVLSEALSLTTGEVINLTGMSRTDAGVHALANEVTFDTDSSIPAERFMYAVRRFLPDDLVIVRGMEVPRDFDIRKQDVLKTYEYRIYCSRAGNPLMQRYFALRDTAPDIGRMQRASEYFLGEHDFRSLANPDSYIVRENLSTVRVVTKVCITPMRGIDFPGGDLGVSILVSGQGFLYNMVRIMCGTLLEVGYGRKEPHDMEGILAARDRKAAGPTLEACGLRLVGANYSKSH